MLREIIKSQQKQREQLLQQMQLQNTGLLTFTEGCSLKAEGQLKKDNHQHCKNTFCKHDLLYYTSIKPSCLLSHNLFIWYLKSGNKWVG